MPAVRQLLHPPDAPANNNKAERPLAAPIASLVHEQLGEQPRKTIAANLWILRRTTQPA